MLSGAKKITLHSALGFKFSGWIVVVNSVMSLDLDAFINSASFGLLDVSNPLMKLTQLLIRACKASI